ncbi:MAG: hypothetical protein F4Y34_01550 [Gammaproteobacteria bacterium]|nr:hypothetical protein [Gammaproteobacteria bacterium]MYH85861.1 hypothetical protein [Gammaproteobacteria bacterium]
MNRITVNKLAKNTGISAETLIKQLKELGANVEAGEDLVTGEQQLRLLQQHRSQDLNKPKTNVSFADINTATNLQALEGLLTQAMADRTIQALIKNERLESIVNSILALVAGPEEELLAAAMLGRLAAVARGRDSKIFERTNQVFSTEPGSIEALADAESKSYAASVLAHSTNPWISEYSYREALNIDSADNARSILLISNLNREENIAQWLKNINLHAKQLNSIQKSDAHLIRARKIVKVMSDVIQQWRGDIGEFIGENLSICLTSLLPSKISDLDQTVLNEVLDSLLAILGRVIELRFSSALYSETYSLVVKGKRLLGPGPWAQFINRSFVLPEIRIALLESALVLARQYRTDKQVIGVLTACYTSRPQVSAAIKRHFRDATDLDPDVADWWKSGGDVSEMKRRVEQKVGNNEDSQIGALLIEVEDNHEAMEKVRRAVVPLLQISEPILSSSVKKAVDGYKNIEQTARRLARMRKLTITKIKGNRLEYNPLEHEMLGGHKAGVRRVKVVRDGIEKKFSGKSKTLVKPWVEPEE